MSHKRLSVWLAWSMASFLALASSATCAEKKPSRSPQEMLTVLRSQLAKENTKLHNLEAQLAKEEEDKKDDEKTVARLKTKELELRKEIATLKNVGGNQELLASKEKQHEGAKSGIKTYEDYVSRHQYAISNRKTSISFCKGSIRKIQKEIEQYQARP